MAGDVFDVLPEASRALLRRREQPAWIEPMLATLSESVPTGSGWLFERKFDGVRCLIFRRDNSVRMYSRNRKPVDSAYPEIHEAISALRATDFIVDGEVVAFAGDVTSFSLLQGRLGLRDALRARGTGIAVHCYLFDLLYAGGHDLTALPLIDRKRVLEKLIAFDEPLRYSAHRIGRGKQYLAQACDKGWEGLMAKRIDSTYQPRRSRDWLKLKCESRQEFVIVGFTDPQGARAGFGALLLGYHDAGRLRYAGKVGTGFDDWLLTALHRRLRAIEVPAPPIDEEPPRMKGTHWVRPQLIGEVAFTEWTPDGRLRHPRFMGLRDDKSPSQITRERAVK